jgi:hypothetical protein
MLEYLLESFVSTILTLLKLVLYFTFLQERVFFQIKYLFQLTQILELIVRTILSITIT